jgi:hypothetical protein
MLYTSGCPQIYHLLSKSLPIEKTKNLKKWLMVFRNTPDCVISFLLHSIVVLCNKGSGCFIVFLLLLRTRLSTLLHIHFLMKNGPPCKVNKLPSNTTLFICQFFSALLEQMSINNKVILCLITKNDINKFCCNRW